MYRISESYVVIMGSTSKIEIVKCALEHNVKFVKSITKPKTIISAVIKGNAYGHGTRVIVPALEGLGINHFSVYSSPEAKVAFEVKKPATTIMIMGFIYDEDFDWIVQNEIEFYVSDMVTLSKAIETSKRLEKKAIIHIDVETGMNRTGFGIRELKQAIPLLQIAQEVLVIRGVTSHFAGAESIANYYRIKKQFGTYKNRVRLLEKNNIRFQIRHIASSAATITYPETQMDLVRTGIILYGYWPTRETFFQFVHKHSEKKDPIRRALKWKSQVIAIKEVPEGEFIGYGLSFQAPHRMRVMIIPVGYSNGYSRSLSNNGHVLLSGHRVAVISSVNMNMIICDITQIEDVSIGDEVILIGEQGENEISFASFAEMNNALNYEILARLPENIERKLIE